MPSEIERLLRVVHAPGVEPPPLERAGEDQALARWSARYGQDRADPRTNPWWAWLRGRTSPRLAVAFAAAILIIVGACVLPTSYEIPLGLAVEITTDAELPHAEIAELVRERGDAAEVDVFVRRHEPDADDPGPARTQMLIRMWDQNLAVGEIEHELREAFPEQLRDATIVETPLEGELETVWGRRIAHRAFHLNLREADVEQARATLLMQLRAQGLTAEQVVVEVRDRPDGHREIKVEIERKLEPGEAAPELSLPLDELGPDARWVLEPE